MKTVNLEIAQRLSAITGRPLEDFYQPPEIVEPIEQIEEQVVSVIAEDVSVAVSKELCTVIHSVDLINLADTYKAEISSNGKLVKNKIQMPRKEFLKLSKTMTEKDLIASPLLYVMFRSEDQQEPNFVRFCESF